MYQITDKKYVIEQMKRSLGDYYFDAQVPEELVERIKSKQKSEKPIPLLTSFTRKNNSGVPMPFVELWAKIFETFDPNLATLEINTVNLVEATGTFWRLYAVYRHGGSYNIVLSQIKRSNNTLQIFWSKQLPILSKRMNPYVLVNRYMIIPLNRAINYFKDKIGD